MNSKLSPQDAIGLGWDRGLGNVWDVFVSRIRRCVCESLDTAIEVCASSADRVMKGDAAVVHSPTHQWVADNVWMENNLAFYLGKSVRHVITGYASRRRMHGKGDSTNWTGKLSECTRFSYRRPRHAICNEMMFLANHTKQTKSRNIAPHFTKHARHQGQS
jgi:hypothetical protein